MFRKTFYIICSILLSSSAIAQTEDDNSDEYVLEEEYVLPFDSLKTKDKMHYSFEVGTGFGNSSIYGNYFSTYYRPVVSFDVSPRFSVYTGLTYVNSSVDNIPVLSESGYQLFSGSISQYDAFIGGKYKLTDKLSVGGSIYYDFTSYNAFDGTALNNGSGLDNIGYSASFEYKATNNLTIQGEVRINDKSQFNQLYTPFHSQSMGMNNMFFGR